ncbi:DJ-1/PfpI family protein [Streptomyces sp. NPDC055400]
MGHPDRQRGTGGRPRRDVGGPARGEPSGLRRVLRCAVDRASRRRRGKGIKSNENRHSGQPGPHRVLTADKVEDIEFFYPYYRFAEEGYDVAVLTPGGTILTAFRGTQLQETRLLATANVDAYDLLFIPGGLAPTALREDPQAVSFVQQFAKTGRPIAALCNGPQLLIAAGLADGRNMTSWKEVAPEARAAGAGWPGVCGVPGSSAAAHQRMIGAARLGRLPGWPYVSTRSRAHAVMSRRR